MDRQLIFIVCLGIVGLTVFGGFYLSPAASTADQPRSTFSPDDIRYKFQQADAKEAAKHKKKPKAETPAKDQFVTNGATSSGGSSESSSDESSDSSADESGVEEPEAEEPPIE
ncbi:MAG: hypothetical protein KBA31_21220 [Alphaproteobacteria bacterium]|nr:hypothetical protein [Alphaproteobacteria bacterium]